MASHKKFLLLVLCVILLQGCNTLKGAAQGAVKGATQGAQQDWENFKKADGWIKENMW